MSDDTLPPAPDDSGSVPSGPPAFENAPFDGSFDASFDAVPFDGSFDSSFDTAPLDVPFDDARFEDVPFAPVATGGAAGGAADDGFFGEAFAMPAFAGAETPAFAGPTFSDADAYAGAAFAGAAYAEPTFAEPAFAGAASAGAAFGGTAFAAEPAGAEATAAEPPAEPPATGRPAQGPRRARKAPGSKDALLLGLHVTPRQVFAVLVRPTADGGYEPLRQFVRNRTDGSAGTVDAGGATPDDLDSAASGDIQFGQTGQVDFSAEFVGLGTESEMSFDAMLDPSSGSQTAVRAQPVIYEIRDILGECEQAGFAQPALAFTVGAPDVEYAEVAIAPETRKGRAAKPGKEKAAKKAEAEPRAEARAEARADAPVKRERLLAELAREFPLADKERTAFVPMTPRDGHQRYFAVMPAASEPVAPSLFMLREQSQYRKTPLRTIEAEVPLLVGLARLVQPADVAENTALVRIGSEDTIVLLLVGGQLHHYEMMQSVTAFDGPDTICSRVLLQQDVQGVGTVHNVIVMAEERERELVQGFAAFYPEARVETLREGMARLGLVGPYGPLAPSLVEATGAALAGHLRTGKGSPFEDANLLPEALRRTTRRVSLAFAWHTLVVAALLFMSVLYFMYTYTQQKQEIAAAQQRLAEYPPETRMSAPELQARIDSLNTRKAELTASLVVLDSLLIGTDLWTQTLLRTTRAAAQTGGVWIEEMTPNGAELELHGYATTRARVVGMAQRLDATINEVTFQALREIPVFEYRMTLALPNELPQVARAMREAAGETLPPPAPLPLAGLSGAPSGSTPPAAAPPAAPPAPPAPAAGADSAGT